jgi:hypothetical protein
MRLYSGKVPTIAQEIVTALARADSTGASATPPIDVVSEEEVQLDIEAVLKEYLRMEREITDEAKNRMEIRGLGYSNLGRVKTQVAKERGAPPNDEVLPYLLDQILNMLFHSNNVEEIYADDVELRTAITPILKRNMDVEGELDKEVRAKIKNLEEGTATFEIEYARMMDQIKRKRGLE